MWKDGSPHTIGRFIESASKHIVVEIRGDGTPARCKFKLKDLRSVTIERAGAEQGHESDD